MQLFTRFENYLKSKDYSPISITGYLHDTRYFARWFEMNTEQPFTMSGYGPSDIQAFRQAMVRRGLKPSTINRRLASIVALGKWGVEMDMIDHNPGLHIRGLDSVLLAPKWLDKSSVTPCFVLPKMIWPWPKSVYPGCGCTACAIQRL